MAGPDLTGSSSLTGAFDLKFVGVSLVIFLLVLWWYRVRGRQTNLPPGPWRWPLLGNVPALAWDGRHPHEVMAQWSRWYGGVMSVGIVVGRPPVIVISDIDATKELLLKLGEQPLERTFLPIAVQIPPNKNINGSLILAKGETATAQRKFCLGAFRKLGDGKKSLEHKINEEARYLIESIEAKKNRSFDPNLIVHKAVSNIISAVCFGSRFDYDDPKFEKLLRTMQLLFSCLGVNSLTYLFPVLICSTLSLYSKPRGYWLFIQDYINGIIQKHRDSYDPNDHRDIIDMYLGEIQEQERAGVAVGTGNDGAAFTHQHIWRSIGDMFNAGTDTTSKTLMWLIAAVLNHPDVQEKLQREISEVVGDDRQPSCEDRPSMPYTNAVLNEIQRWRPVAPFSLLYETTREIQLKGYTIPKGRRVVVSLWAMMNDPRIWNQPEQFNPDRFLGKDGTKLIQHESFIPFSIGRRGCIGEGLARMELFVFATNLFQRFTFKLPLGAPKPSMKGIPRFTFVPEPFEVCADDR